MAESENLKSFIKDNKRLLREYFETRGELIRLKFIRLFSNLAGQFIWLILCLFLFWLFVFFLALVAGFWLSDITGSYPLGFGITTLAILLSLITLAVWGKKPMVNSVIRRIIISAANETNSKGEQTED